MSGQKLKTIYNGITEIWRFFRKYADGDPDKQEFWNQALEEAGTIHKRYDNNFIRKMVVGAVEEIERCHSRKENN